MNIDEIVIELGDVSEMTLGFGTNACEADGLGGFVQADINDPGAVPNLGQC